MGTPRASQRLSKAEWQEIMDRFDRSGLPQKCFCEKEGIAHSTFAYHRYARKNKLNSMPVFQPVQVSPAASRTSSFVIRLPNGLCCEVASGFSPSEVRTLLEALCQC